MIDLQKLNIKNKIKLFKKLYEEISGKGIQGDTELAHINSEEAQLLKLHGGAGTINEETGLKQYFGGGGSGGGGGQPANTTQMQTVREAPEIEARKIALYDQAASLASQPISLPAVQVAAPTALQQQGFAQAGTTGVGQQAVGQGITSLQAGLGSAFAGPNISQFFNPYQSYVTDEINRQAAQAQNQLSATAIGSGAFGGGREGVAKAELERARLATVGQSQAQGFGQALQAAQNQQSIGLQAGQQLGQFGAQQQAMQLGQQALEAQRQTQLQQAYEPYQRTEFLKGIMTNLPTSQSGITATTAPGTSPLAQAAGAGLGAYMAFRK